MELYKNCKINNNDEAYLIGFIYADGCITGFRYNKYRILSITLSQKDESFLNKIHEKFFSHKPSPKIKKVRGKDKDYSSCSMNICDTELAQRLITIGIYPRKTYNEDVEKLISNIPVEMIPCFLCGYFDGDGSIFRKEKNRYGVNFVSHQEKFLLFVLDYFKKHDIGNNVSPFKDGNNYRISFNGNNNVRKIEELLYKNRDGFFMDRKKEKFKNVPEKVNKIHVEYVSIYYLKENNKWGVFIYVDVNNQRKYLGLYDDITDAVNRYNEEARKLNKKEQEITDEKNRKCNAFREMVKLRKHVIQ